MNAIRKFPDRCVGHSASILCMILSAKITASATMECRAGDGRANALVPGVIHWPGNGAKGVTQDLQLSPTTEMLGSAKSQVNAKPGCYALRGFCYAHKQQHVPCKRSNKSGMATRPVPVTSHPQLGSPYSPNVGKFIILLPQLRGIKRFARR